MHWKIARRGAMVTAAAGATLALTAVPALADVTARHFDGNDRVTARATYITNGDNVRVCDTWPDGHSAVGQLYVEGYGFPRDAWASGGFGTCSTAYWDFQEGRPYRVRACVGEGGSQKRIISCGPWRYGRT